MKQKRAAMEMSVGTMVTIVLLVTVLILGLTLVRGIFRGATDSIDSINEQVKSEIDNLFNTAQKEIVVSLGAKQTANVKRGTQNFGFVFGYYPDDPTELMNDKCYYNIEASDTGQYCSRITGWDKDKVKDWIISGTNRVSFDRLEKDTGYALVTLSIPEGIPTCEQKFYLEVTCPGSTSSKSFFQINVIKKGIF